MADLNSVGKVTLISEIFKNMSYGPVTDSSTYAKAWINDNKLGPFIDNSYKDTAYSVFEVREGCSGSVITNVGQSTENDVNEAVSSSLKAADLWSKLSPHHRARHLYSLARHLQKHSSTLAQIESLNRGVQSRDPRDFDMPTMVRYFYHYAGWAQHSSSNELADWKPLGVVAGVVSSSSCLATLGFIIAPALAAGNSVCLKPSQRTPLTALLFANIASQAGLPPGVINVLPGDKDVGKLLVSHGQISKVTFSGSPVVSRLIQEETAGLGVHLTTLLNGGRSSMLVFDSADLDAGVDCAVDAAWFNQGQAPWCVGTVLIQESIWKTFNSKLRARIEQLHVGTAFDHQADIGSPHDKKIVTNVADAVARAKTRGLEVFQKELPSSLPSEEFFPPTLIIGGFPYSNQIVEEDITAPLIAAVPFRTAREAIAIANNSRYGLAASVWSENAALAMEVAYQLQVGTVWINSHGTMDAGVPFGIWKQSGSGILGGREGLYEYMQYKDVRANTTMETLDYKSYGTLSYALECYPDTQSRGNFQQEIDCTYKLYYGGTHKRPDSGLYRTLVDETGKVYASVPEGSRKDVRNAVEVAMKAQPTWWKLGSHGRAQILYNAAEKLQLRREDFISHLTTLYGKTDKEAAVKEVDMCMNLLFHWAASCDKNFPLIGDVNINRNALNVGREALGVIGIVQASVPGPWALASFIALFAPAVCYGNSVVVLANYIHPTPAIEFCQVIDTSDFPAGVVNVLTGNQERMLTTLANHQEVAAVWAPSVPAVMAKYVQWAARTNFKHVWVDKLPCFDSLEKITDCRELFERHATKVKSIWMPYGEMFAN